MTHVSHTYTYRNASDTATIYIERYSDLYVWGWSEYCWRVCIKRDDAPYATEVKDKLKNKPTQKRIQKYIEEL